MAADCKVISCFRRRQSASAAHGNCFTRAGGKTEAICELWRFYTPRYTPVDTLPKAAAIDGWRRVVGPITSFVITSIPATWQVLWPRWPHASFIVTSILATCQHGKSCGPGGPMPPLSLPVSLRHANMASPVVQVAPCLLYHYHYACDMPTWQVLWPRWPHASFIITTMLATCQHGKSCGPGGPMPRLSLPVSLRHANMASPVAQMASVMQFLRLP